MTDRGGGARVSVFWILLLGVAWWILADPDAGGFWWAGAVGVLTGGFFLHLLGGGRRVRVRVGPAMAFVPYFLLQSLKGGTDVAIRALHPSLPLNPNFLAYRLSLPPGFARIFLANVLSLLPGTLSAELQGERLTVHLLTEGPDAEERVRELERRVGTIFGKEGTADG